MKSAAIIQSNYIPWKGYFHIIRSVDDFVFLDVRSPGEFRGEITHMPEYPQEGVLRGGHIPGAKSCPWSTAANADGTFKTADQLKSIYIEDNNVNPEDEVITYCDDATCEMGEELGLKLLEKSIPRVGVFIGGFEEWKQRGEPVDSG